MSNIRETEIDTLRAKLAGLEALRDELDAAILDAKRAEIESRIAELIDTAGGAVVAGDVQTGAGSFIGQNQLAAIGARSVVIDGNADRIIVCHR